MACMRGARSASRNSRIAGGGLLRKADLKLPRPTAVWWRGGKERRCSGRGEGITTLATGEDRKDRFAAMWSSMFNGLVRKKWTSSRSLITSLGEHPSRLSRALRKVFCLILLETWVL